METFSAEPDVSVYLNDKEFTLKFSSNFPSPQFISISSQVEKCKSKGIKHLISEYSQFIYVLLLRISFDKR